jgi:hypothetical protein
MLWKRSEGIASCTSWRGKVMMMKVFMNLTAREERRREDWIGVGMGNREEEGWMDANLSD